MISFSEPSAELYAPDRRVTNVISSLNSSQVTRTHTSSRCFDFFEVELLAELKIALPRVPLFGVIVNSSKFVIGFFNKISMQ